MATREDLAYAAGIIDGEGCISIMRQKRSTMNYALYVRVATADDVIAPWLHQTFGGCLNDVPRYEGERQARAWGVASQAAENFLIMILPWLKLKREQALLALEFRKSFHGGTGHYISDELRESRRLAYEKMRALKNERAPSLTA